MEHIGHIVASFIRMQEQADREREACQKLMTLPGHENEAATCLKKADSLQMEASKLLGEYQRIRRCESDNTCRVQL